MEWTYCEDFFPAGDAAIGGKTQQPFHENENPRSRMLGRNAAELEIAALRAVRVAGEPSRNTPSVKPQFTTSTAPGAQPAPRAEEIPQSGPVGAKTIGTAATRTNHSANSFLGRASIAKGDSGQKRPRRGLGFNPAGVK